MKRKNRRYRFGSVQGMGFLLIVLLAGALAVFTGTGAAGFSGRLTSEPEIRRNVYSIENLITSGDPGKTDIPWNLILVNQGHPIPENYEVELTVLSNGRKVDSRIYPELQTMFDDARSAGLGLFVREGYRTYNEQQALMDEKVDYYRNAGYGKTEAQRLAQGWVAVPGTSEHELGLAVDINADTSVSSSDMVYKWLEENSYKYGFILRYPSDKAEITKINNEPWHFRYVGKEAAVEMYNSNLCLEEYLQKRGEVSAS